MEEKNLTPEKERLEKQIRFIMEADKVKNIFRQTYLADGERKENDAEHSWHLAMMAVLLQEHMKEKADLAKAMTMVLIHDLVEIDAGDTYAYDEKGAQTKRRGKSKPQTGSSGFCRKTREHISGNCGRNLKRTRRRRQNLPISWTISSLFF